MISLVFAVFLGIFFAIIAVQNPAVVTLQFFDFVFALPLYIIAATSFLAGIFITTLFSLFDRTKFDLAKREHQISNLARTNQSLGYQMQKVQAENQKLREELQEVRAQVRSEKWEGTKQKVKNFFDPIRHNPA